MAVLECVAAHARANKEAMKATYTFTVLRSQYCSRFRIGSTYRIGGGREVSQTELLGDCRSSRRASFFSFFLSLFFLSTSQPI